VYNVVLGMNEFSKRDLYMFIGVLLIIILIMGAIIYTDKQQINNLSLQNEALIDERDELKESLIQSDEVFSKQTVLVRSLMEKLSKYNQ